jgi:hypothetical protein
LALLLLLLALLLLPCGLGAVADHLVCGGALLLFPFKLLDSGHQFPFFANAYLCRGRRAV